MPDPLPVVARLRRLEVDAAQRALAECLRDEAAAALTLRALDTAITAETDAATASEDDRAVEDFALWLHRTERDRAAAEAVLARAETRSTEARAVLSATRSAARAMDEILTVRAAERQAVAAGREQIALDEAGCRRNGRD